MTPEGNQKKSTRRDLLGASALGFASLGLGAAPAAAAPAETGPWNGGDVPENVRAAREMALAARAFLDAWPPALRAKASFAQLGDAARTKWSNFPAGAAPRPGVAIAGLSDAQRVALHALLRASTSSQGYHKMTGAIRADDVLHQLGGEALFGSGNYYATVFGSPESVDWAWMLTGHHMTAVFTVSKGRVAFTPMFTGSQPLQIATGTEAGWIVLPQEARLAGGLLASLSAAQRQLAVIGTDAPFDVFEGPGRQASLSAYRGIPSGKLDAAQQRLLWLLVEEFVGNADASAADAQLLLVRNGWRDTHFAWQGPSPEPSSRYYFRVHGPRILIEYDVQEPLTSGGGHVHAITRDPLNDYGTDWLALHYRESPAHPGGNGPPGGGPPGGRPPGPPAGGSPAPNPTQ